MTQQLTRVILTVLLSAAVSAQHDGGMMHGGMAGMSMGNDTGCANLDICVAEPTRENCTLPFKLPHPCSVSDATKLCNAMHFMTACSVAKACNASGADWAKNALGPGRVNVSRNNPDICRPFQHIVTVCRLDTGMSKMAGCAHYNTMCVNGSKVDMCSNVTGITALPTTREVNDQVRAICEAKDQPGCEQCMPSWKAGKTWGDCDLLAVYSGLCSSSPDMKQCGAWSNMCAADPTLWLCKNYTGPAAVTAAGGAPAGDAAAASASAKSAAAFAVPGVFRNLVGMLLFFAFVILA